MTDDTPMVAERYVIVHRDFGKDWFWHPEIGWQQGFENGYWFKERQHADDWCEKINRTSALIRTAKVRVLNAVKTV